MLLLVNGKGFALNGDSLDNPDFEGAERRHDWRNHVGDRTIALWSTFTAEQILALALDAQERADREDWE